MKTAVLLLAGFLAIICPANFLQAQQPTITKVYYDLTIGAQGYAIVNTFEGNYLIAGERDDISMVMKIDSAGSILWVKKFGDEVGSRFQYITQTHDSCYLVSGGSSYMGMAGNYINCIKIRSNGDTIFSRSYLFLQPAYIQSMKMTNDSGFILCGILDANSILDNKIFVLKIDATGAVMWNKIFSSGNDFDFGHSISQTSDGGYILAGETYGVGDLNNAAVLIKLNQGGEITWSKKLFTTSSTAGWDAVETTDGYLCMIYDFNGYLKFIRTDFSGNFILGRRYYCSIFMNGYGYPVPRLKKSLDGGYFFITTGWGYGDHLIKMDSAAAFQWSTMLQLITTDVAESDDQSYMVLGNGPIMGVIMAPTDNPQIGLLKTDSLAYSNCSWPDWIAMDTAIVSVSGLSFSTSTGVTTVAYNPMIINKGLSIYEGCVAVTGSVKEVPKSEIKVSPNPSDGVITITLDPALQSQTEMVEVFDGTGGRVYASKVPDANSINLDFSFNPNGIYMVRVFTANKTMQSKFLIIH